MIDYTDYLTDTNETPKRTGFTGWSPLPLMARKWHYYSNSRSACGKHTNYQKVQGSIIKPADKECCQPCLKEYNLLKQTHKWLR